MANSIHLVTRDPWKIAMALVIGVAFILNGWASMRRSTRVGDPLAKWLGIDLKAGRPWAIANGVSMLVGIIVLVLLTYSLLRE